MPKINPWKQTLPKPQAIVSRVEAEVKAQAIQSLEKLSTDWIAENKLIHAGAAQRLARKLKATLDGDSQ